MPAIFELLYRAYCNARLAEIRKQLLLRPKSREVPEANCDAEPDREDDRDSSPFRSFRDGLRLYRQDIPASIRPQKPQSVGSPACACVLAS
jgi:hypothetical protein